MYHRWLHVLLRGHVGGPDEYVQEFAARSLEAIHLPALEFEYINTEKLKGLLKSLTQDTSQEPGLIVTSPRVVESIRRTLDDHELRTLSTSLRRELVFAVGGKTAQECERILNVRCNTESTTSDNSAKLARIIMDTCERGTRPVRLIYPKSSLADATIESALDSIKHVHTDVIIAYETRPLSNLGTILIDKISEHLAANGDPKLHVEHLHINLIFFSPSGVKGFHELDLGKLTAGLIERVQPEGPLEVEWKHSCIGRTTEAALRRGNLDVLCVADKPNARSLVEAVARSCKP